MSFDAAVGQVEKNTAHLYPLWMQNWSENLRQAKNGDSLDKIFSKPPADKVLVVGRGPSLMKRNHVELLRKHRFQGTVVSSDGALPLLAEAGMIPQYSFTVDGSPLIAKWFQGKALEKIGSKVKAILPVTVHPDTVKSVKQIGGHIFWYIPQLDSEPYKGLTQALQMMTLSKANPTGLSTANGAGNSGLASIVFAATILRAKSIILCGMDNGYSADTPLKMLHYHENLLKSAGVKPELVASLYRTYFAQPWEPYLKKDDCYCIVDPVFQLYLQTYNRLADQITDAGIKLINCTEGGCLIHKTRCMPFEEYLRNQKHSDVTVLSG